jgi:hypothetical protein
LFGIGIFFLLASTLSPRTHLADQLSVVRGLLKILGFMKLQINKIIIGIRENQPIHTLLQILRTNRGKIINRVQTLMGLA